MQVNLDQFGGAVGACNSRLHYKNIYNNISIKMLDVLLISSAFLTIILTFSMLLLFSKSFDHFTQAEYENLEHISNSNFSCLCVSNICVSCVVVLDFN